MPSARSGGVGAEELRIATMLRGRWLGKLENKPVPCILRLKSVATRQTSALESDAWTILYKATSTIGRSTQTRR